MEAAQGALCEDSGAVLPAEATTRVATVTALLAATLTLEACGGSSSPAPPAVVPPVTAPVFRTTEVAASRFLGQATTGATTDSIARVRILGFDGWLTEQFAAPRSQALWDWMVAAGYNVPANLTTQAGFDPAIWSQLITATDQLRQRVGLALQGNRVSLHVTNV